MTLRVFSHHLPVWLLCGDFWGQHPCNANLQGIKPPTASHWTHKGYTHDTKPQTSFAPLFSEKKWSHPKNHHFWRLKINFWFFFHPQIANFWWPQHKEITLLKHTEISKWRFNRFRLPLKDGSDVTYDVSWMELTTPLKFNSSPLKMVYYNPYITE